MLFNSYIFIFIFLPITLLGFHLIGNRGHHRIAIAWLVAASLFFYGWWNPAYLGLILGSILINYMLGVALSRSPLKALLTLGVVLNLGVLAYYKYANFFIDNLNQFLNNSIEVETILLPLAISFFTFQQIAYLVDAYKGKAREYSFLHYCLFVTFFPQFIAGPIVHHKEMLPQFSNDALYKLKASHLAVGLTIFFIGLFKKVVFADGIAIYSTLVFKAAESGIDLTVFEAWCGAFAYTFQLYFDFSGYSDMALGVARMFGVILPVNFFSPYKANNIIEFWRRWHITLSKFLRDYLYIPLGGNRKGSFRRYTNLMLTMILGGLWHGAGWTFLIWGGMHGLYLVINHQWHRVKSYFFGNEEMRDTVFGRVASRTVTFISVVLAWVMFRAESLSGAINMYTAMFGFNGISLPLSLEPRLNAFHDTLNAFGVVYKGMFVNEVIVNPILGLQLIALMLFIIFFTPNTLEYLRQEKPALNVKAFLSVNSSRIVWKPSILYLSILIIIASMAIMNIQKESEFLYFQF